MALRKENREKFHYDGYCYSTLGLLEQAGLVDFQYKYVRADFLDKSFTVGLIKIYQYGKDYQIRCILIINAAHRWGLCTLMTS